MIIIIILLYDNTNNENSEKMLLKIIKLHNIRFNKYEKNKNYFRCFVDTLNWLECYRNEIILLLKIYILLESILNDNILRKSKIIMILHKKIFFMKYQIEYLQILQPSTKNSFRYWNVCFSF